MTTKTITGPRGLRIVLDASQIFPDDPGAGAPAIVYKGRDSGTFWCALDTGELDAASLSQSDVNWLDAQLDAVETFLDQHSR